jgi:hypothetical protein
MKAIVKTRKDADPEFLQLYKSFMDSQADDAILQERFVFLKDRLREFVRLVSEFGLELCKHNVPIDDSIIKFACRATNKEFADYCEFKDSDVYLSIMQTCVLFKQLFENFDIKCQNDEMDIRLFSFSIFDFKSIIVCVEDREAKALLFDKVRAINDVCVEFTNEAFEPPFDVDKMGELFNRAICMIENKIDRCQDAFYILKRSASKFKENYKTYYKETAQTGNQLLVIKSFISDISNDPEITKTHKKKAQLSWQFKKILMFLQDNYLKNVKDVNPMVNNLLKMALKNLS